MANFLDAVELPNKFLRYKNTKMLGIFRSPGARTLPTLVYIHAYVYNRSKKKKHISFINLITSKNEICTYLDGYCLLQFYSLKIFLGGGGGASTLGVSTDH